MKKSQTFAISDLIILLVVFIIGIILITKSSFVISLLSWIIGGVLGLIGIIKIIHYFVRKKISPEFDSLVIGILMIAGGVLLVIFPNIIDITIRIVFGGWILFTGINRLILAFTIMRIDKIGFKMFLITSIVIVLAGVLVLINFYELVGLLLVIYAIAEIVNYVYFNCKKDSYSSIFNFETANTNTRNKKVKQIKQEIKEKEAIDAVIDQ